jgi:hypothetical protein
VRTNGSDPFAKLRRFEATRLPPKQVPTERKRKPPRPILSMPFCSFPHVYCDKLREVGASGTAWVLWRNLDELIYGPTRNEPLTIMAQRSRHRGHRQGSIGTGRHRDSSMGSGIRSRPESRHHQPADTRQRCGQGAIAMPEL